MSSHIRIKTQFKEQQSEQKNPALCRIEVNKKPCFVSHLLGNPIRVVEWFRFYVHVLSVALASGDYCLPYNVFGYDEHGDPIYTPMPRDANKVQ